MLTANIKYSGYENIIVDCPLSSCGHELVFNRASDLCTFTPISGTEVSCFKCKGSFWLNGDSANERHELLIFDCHDLLKRKRYMNCILNACQAYEMFFSLYLRVELIFKPLARSYCAETTSLEQWNDLSTRLGETIQGYAFERMRALFLERVIDPVCPKNLDEANGLIESIRNPEIPSDREIKSVRDTELAELLMMLKETGISALRNKVVHKSGYRPTRDEAKQAHEEAESILFPLTWLLDLHDEINWYRMRKS